MDIHEQFVEAERRFPSVDIYSTPGTKVVFNGNGGYPAQLERANSLLTIGRTYTLSGSSIGRWESTLFLEEVPGYGFNSVHFCPEGWTPPKEPPQ